MEAVNESIEVISADGPTFLKIFVLKPSGPGDLSDGKFLITLPISCLEKGSRILGYIMMSF